MNADNQLLVNGNLTGVNLFAYCGNDPVNRIDPTGEAWWHWVIGAAIVVACAVAVVVTAGGTAAGIYAVASVANGVATTSTTLTVAAGAFIGSSIAYGSAVLTAASNSDSIQDFNEQGNWDTVITTTIGAVVGGTVAYTSKQSYTSNKASQKTKITSTIKNEVIDLPRTGHALKTDRYHAFPNIIDNYVGYATKSKISNGTLYQLQGSLNGISGRFEWIVQNQQVTHRLFVPGGGINGIPITP